VTIISTDRSLSSRLVNQRIGDSAGASIDVHDEAFLRYFGMTSGILLRERRFTKALVIWYHKTDMIN
jgi:hypothetical protein